MGCANAAAYSDLGKLESYKASGLQVVLAASMRGQAVPAPNMSPLSPEERQLVQLYTAEAGRIFGAQMQQFEALLGQRQPEHVVHHCGSGVSAVPNILAMEIAGLPGSALFAGSWSEWCNRPGFPVAQG